MDNVKDLSVYKKMFDEDVSSFNEFQALDYIRELKNQGKNDEAIYVGRTFLEQCPHLHDYINAYAYALYNRYIHLEDEEIKANEALFYDIVEEILAHTRQEKYSPLEATIQRSLKYELNKDPVDYKKVNDLLDKLDAPTLDSEPFIAPNGKEYESKKEKWYRMKVNTLYHLGEYSKVIEEVNKAIASHFKWHFQNQNWLNYYRAISCVKVGRFEEAENEFIRLQKHFHTQDLKRALIELYNQTGREKEANLLVIYDFFYNGLHKEELPNYKLLQNIVKDVDEKAYDLVTKLILKLEDNSLDYLVDDVFDEAYKVIMNHLDKYVDRYQGRVIYYNNQKQFGLISQSGDKRIFFVQADYVYDDDVYKYDDVEYSIIKSYDRSKKEMSERAILIRIKL